MSEVTYVCEVCRKETKIPEGKPTPLCCARKMEPLPFCTSVPNPEMARNYQDDQPCDDGTTPDPKE